MFDKILIANRGETALRIIRSCKEMGIRTVIAYSKADIDSMAVKLADESICIGRPPAKDSYLNIPAILSAATIAGVDAVHPGIGFLAENPEFATMVEEHGFAFIGPSSSHIKGMGDKIAAKQLAQTIGLPVVPGSPGPVKSLEEAIAIAENIGFPVIIKAVAGGGGRGMQIVKNKEQFAEAFNIAKNEALSFFGNGSVYLEKFLAQPRHIEVQVLGDKHGNIVHLGERDCSVQRRHQKVWEEAPSPILSKTQRNEIGSIVVKALKKIDYYSAGTIEFLFENGHFYFMEMNTRLQVEHTITEMITGIDLVEEQIKVAAGLPLPFKQEDITIQGHAIECRINAEDSFSFVPSVGKVNSYHAPGGLGVRVDSHIYQGYSIPPFYDNMVAKVITHSKDRAAAINKMRRALSELVIDGINTNTILQARLTLHKDILSGNYDIKWLEKEIDNLKKN